MSYSNIVGQTRGGLTQTATGPGPRQLSYVDPGRYIDWFLRNKKKEEEKPTPAPVLTQAPKPQAQAPMIGHGLTPKAFATPSMSPQGVIGYNVNPLDVPIALQGQVPTGFFTDNAASNYTYSPTVRPGQNVPRTQGGGGMSFHMPSPEKEDPSIGGNPAAARMYPGLAARMNASPESITADIRARGGYAYQDKQQQAQSELDSIFGAGGS